MKREEILGFIGLLYSAHKVAIGDNVMTLLAKNKISLIILSDESSDNTKKRISDKARYYGVELISEFTKNELANALGKGNISFLGIADKKAAEALKNKLKEER